jgi:hypothetical protein
LWPLPDAGGKVHGECTHCAIFGLVARMKRSGMQEGLATREADPGLRISPSKTDAAALMRPSGLRGQRSTKAFSIT